MDPQLQTILDELAAKSAGAPPMPLQSPDDIRRGDLRFSQMCIGGRTLDPVGRVQEHVISGPGGDLRLRSYAPETPAIGALMFFHGGAFLMGGLDSHDHICRALCHASGAVVVAVEYRLAPENKFPAPVEDCWAATLWVASASEALGYPQGRLAVSGDSAGGALAAVLSIKARDAGGPAIAFQLLYYPEASASLDWPSVKAFWEPGRMSAGKGMGFFRSKYFASPEQANDPNAYPDTTADLSGLPPALVITAEIDPMRDMGEAYARRLEAAGVATTLTRYDGLTHVFLSMFPRVDAARRALDQGATAVHDALASA